MKLKRLEGFGSSLEGINVGDFIRVKKPGGAKKPMPKKELVTSNDGLVLITLYEGQEDNTIFRGQRRIEEGNLDEVYPIPLERYEPPIDGDLALDAIYKSLDKLLQGEI